MRLLTQEEYKRIIIEVLFKVDEICRENNLHYMMFYGTLIGAVRHKGMIPWDDDIDIVMPRKDYQKLCDLINKGDYPISFIDIMYNKDTIFPHGKICDKTTVLYEKNFRIVEGYGAFIDVFPLDYAPDNYEKRIREKNHLRRLVRLETHCARTGFMRSPSNIVNIKRMLAYGISRLISPQLILRMINKFVLDRDCVPTGYYRVFGGDTFPVSWLDSYSEIEFEGRRLLAPADPDVVLKHCYGDYMTLPPEEERISNHSLVCYIND